MNPKDAVENKLKTLVCDAVDRRGPYLRLADAQRLIATDWTTAVAEADVLLVNRSA